MKKNRAENNYILIIGILSSILIVFSWIISYYFLKDDPNRGTLGDMFGMINSLFSGLALAGIIITILLQKQELSYQREELVETRQEFIIQNSTLKYQRFENTFFNLLSLHHQIVSGIDDIEEKSTTSEEPMNLLTFRNQINNPKLIQHVIINGRDVFKRHYSVLIESIKKNKDKNYVDIYMKNYEHVQTDFGHYFRNLYRIIKFIDETKFEEEDNDFVIKYKYTSMLRAQLSDYELLWLFYNCLSPNGKYKFKPYIEKYSFFKNLPQDKLHSLDLINLYEKTAFEKSII